MGFFDRYATEINSAATPIYGRFKSMIKSIEESVTSTGKDCLIWRFTIFAPDKPYHNKEVINRSFFSSPGAIAMTMRSFHNAGLKFETAAELEEHYLSLVGKWVEVSVVPSDFGEDVNVLQAIPVPEGVESSELIDPNSENLPF